MKKGGGRSKGNAFENKVAKRVVRAFKKFGIKRTDCYRTPLSGGHRFAKREDPGDLVISKTLRKWFPFVVECKAYKKINWWRFFIPEDKWKRSWLEGRWVRQVLAATGKQQGNRAENEERLYPVLVMKENNAPWMVAVDALSHMGQLDLGVVVTLEGRQWRVISFEQLLKECIKSVEVSRRKML